MPGVAVRTTGRGLACSLRVLCPYFIFARSAVTSVPHVRVGRDGRNVTASRCRDGDRPTRALHHGLRRAARCVRLRHAGGAWLRDRDVAPTVASPGWEALT